MSDWNYWYFHQISHDQDSRLDMKVTTVKTSRISLYSVWSSYAHIPVSETLADGDKELGRENMGVLKVPDFYGAIIGKKTFFISKNIHMIYVSLMWAFLFLNLTHCGKKHVLLFALVNFKLSAFVNGALY